MRLLLTLVAVTGCALQATGQPAAENSSQVELRRRTYHDALVTAISQHEASLTRDLKLQKQGAGSEMEVNAGRQALAILRHDAAINNEDPDEAREQSRALVKLRQVNVERLLKLRAAGAVPAVVVLAARRQMANSKFILAAEGDEAESAETQLKAIVDICAAELALVEEAAKAGSASPAEVSLARGRKAYANYLLEDEKDNPDKATSQLRIVIAERESAANRMDTLVRTGAAARIMLVEAQFRVLSAQANLAIEEDRRDETREILKKIAGAIKENLAHWKTQPDTTTPELISRISAALADCELRLALVADPDTSLRSLLRKSIFELDY